jgi:hypothetical protein
VIIRGRNSWLLPDSAIASESFKVETSRNFRSYLITPAEFGQRCEQIGINVPGAGSDPGYTVDFAASLGAQSPFATSPPFRYTIALAIRRS